MNDLTDEERIQQAKDGVLSLGLDKMGLGYIEEACLSELDAYANEGDITLEEYVVFIPKNRAATPTYFCAYKGLSFYETRTSKSNYTKISKAKGEQLKNWVEAGISLILLHNQKKVIDIAWTVLTAGSSLASNYEKHTEPWVDNCTTYNPTTQSLYVKMVILMNMSIFDSMEWPILMAYTTAMMQHKFHRQTRLTTFKKTSQPFRPLLMM